VSIERALEIDGWMTERELRWLEARAAEHSVIVEVGSYLGRSTEALAGGTRGVVIAFDDWIGPRDADLSDQVREGLYSRFCENMKPWLDHGRIIAVKRDHATATGYDVIPGGPGLRPDMVFIDGDHRYESVYRDIQLWLPRLAPLGLICGHDISHSEVMRAVLELLPAVKIVHQTSIWTFSS
jgi:hypothetical protein